MAEDDKDDQRNDRDEAGKDKLKKEGGPQPASAPEPPVPPPPPGDVPSPGKTGGG